MFVIATETLNGAWEIWHHLLTLNVRHRGGMYTHTQARHSNTWNQQMFRVEVTYPPQLVKAITELKPEKNIAFYFLSWFKCPSLDILSKLLDFTHRFFFIANTILCFEKCCVNIYMKSQIHHVTLKTMCVNCTNKLWHHTLMWRVLGNLWPHSSELDSEGHVRGT